MKEIFNNKPASDKVLANPFSTPPMPEYDEIPKEFKKGQTKWNKFFNDMFFSGVKDVVLYPKNGINRDKAFRHLLLWAHSFKPSHEHKEAAFAYVMSLWFEDVKWTRREKSW